MDRDAHPGEPASLPQRPDSAAARSSAGAAAAAQLPPPSPGRPPIARPPELPPPAAGGVAAAATGTAMAAYPDSKEGAGAATSALARGGGAATVLEPTAGDASAAVAPPGAGYSSPYASMDQSSTAFESAPATLMTPPQPLPSPTKPTPPPPVPQPTQPDASLQPARIPAADAPCPPQSPPATGSAAYAAVPPIPQPATHAPQYPAHPHATPLAQGPSRDTGDGTMAATESNTFPDVHGRASASAPHPTAAAAALSGGTATPPPGAEDPAADGLPHPGAPTNISVDSPSNPGIGSGWFRPTTGGNAHAPGGAPDAPAALGAPTNGYGASGSVPYGGDAHKDRGAGGPSGIPPGERYASAYGVLPTINSAQDSVYGPLVPAAVPPPDRPPPPPGSNQQFHRFYGAEVRCVLSQFGWQQRTGTHGWFHRVGSHCNAYSISVLPLPQEPEDTIYI